MGTGTGRLPLSAQLAVAGGTWTPLSSPLSLLTSYLHVWTLAGDLGGAGTRAQTLFVVSLPPSRPLLPCNMNSHWSPSVVMFVFCWGSQRREVMGQWEEVSSHSSSGSSQWQTNTPQTPAFVLFFITKVTWHLILLFKTSYIWSLQNKFWCGLPLCLKGFLSDKNIWPLTWLHPLLLLSENTQTESPVDLYRRKTFYFCKLN